MLSGVGLSWQQDEIKQGDPQCGVETGLGVKALSSQWIQGEGSLGRGLRGVASGAELRLASKGDMMNGRTGLQGPGLELKAMCS